MQVRRFGKHGAYRVRHRPHRDVERHQGLHARDDPCRATAGLAHLRTRSGRPRPSARPRGGLDQGSRAFHRGGRRPRRRGSGGLLQAWTGGAHRPRRRRSRDDAQGPAVRHGIRLRHLPARTGAQGRHRGCQRSSQPARLQREVLRHRFRRLHTTARGGGTRGYPGRFSRRARRRSVQETRRHGRYEHLPDTPGRPQPPGGGRDADRQRHDTGHGSEIHPGDPCRGQANPADRRRARTLRAGAHSEAGRDPGQPGRGWRGGRATHRRTRRLHRRASRARLARARSTLRRHRRHWRLSHGDQRHLPHLHP